MRIWPHKWDRALLLKPGMTVAEVGAGTGDMTLRVAEKVGPSGHVFSTEIDPKRIRQIHKAVEKQRLTNVTVITGAEAETGLPAECCDAIFMRDVYHHFTHPVEMNRSVFRNLQCPPPRLRTLRQRPRDRKTAPC